MFIGISYSKCFWSFSFVISINEIASVDSFSLHKLCIKGIYSIKSNNVTSLTNKRIIGINWPRLRVVPHFSSGIVEQAKRERAWKSPHARKGDTRRGERMDVLNWFGRGYELHTPKSVGREGSKAWALSVVPHFSLSPPCVAFSRVGWFLRALAFRSLYYPWGKMGDCS